MTRSLTAPGRLVAGRYRLESQIGGGGMGAVWLARDERLGRMVAVKQVLSASGATPEEADQQRQRALREGRIAARLSHPHAISVYDVAVEAGQPWLVMEYLPSRSLGEVLAEDGILREDVVAQIGAQVADALAATHAAGIVHRDVKPANILLASDGLPGRPLRAKLADFGIARIVDSSRLTTTGVIIGTATYLSPEQALGNDIGPAADVYALGIVLIEALTGRNPFPGSAVESASARMVREPDIPDSLGASWGSLLADMTRLDPAKRMSAADVAVAARRIARAAEHAPDLGGTGADETVVEPAPPVTPPASTMPETAAMTMAYPEETTDAADEAPTERVARTRGGGATAAVAAAAATGHRVRRRLIVAASAVLIAAAATVGAIAWGGASSPQPSAPPASPYPSVPGTLGTHLKQLQDSVRP
jgi:hypothetical protein